MKFLSLIFQATLQPLAAASVVPGTFAAEHHHNLNEIFLQLLSASQAFREWSRCIDQQNVSLSFFLLGYYLFIYFKAFCSFALKLP